MSDEHDRPTRGDLVDAAHQAVAHPRDPLAPAGHGAGFITKDRHRLRRYSWHLSASLGMPLDPEQGRPLVDYGGRAWTWDGAYYALGRAAIRHSEPRHGHALDADRHARRAYAWARGMLAASGAALGALVGGLAAGDGLGVWWWPCMAAAVVCHLAYRRECRARDRHTRARDEADAAEGGEQPDG